MSREEFAKIGMLSSVQTALIEDNIKEDRGQNRVYSLLFVAGNEVRRYSLMTRLLENWIPQVVPNASKVRFPYGFFLIIEMYEPGKILSTSNFSLTYSSSRCASLGVCSLSRTRFASSIRPFTTSHRGVSGNIGSRKSPIKNKVA